MFERASCQQLQLTRDTMLYHISKEKTWYQGSEVMSYPATFQQPRQSHLKNCSEMKPNTVNKKQTLKFLSL